MPLDFKAPEKLLLKPVITVFGVGGAGGNAVNNMIRAKLEGANFVVANTDAQALKHSECQNKLQLGASLTKGLGAGASAEVGAKAAEESEAEIRAALEGSNMVFITAGMGGGTGTGASPVIARIAKGLGILTVAIVTKPFFFEGEPRMRSAEAGLKALQQHVNTLIIIPNQNIFSRANENTSLAEAFAMADEVLHGGVRGVVDLITQPGLINLDFADIKTVMSAMGKAMMGTGEGTGEDRAIKAAEAAIDNPLLAHTTIRGATNVLINITGSDDMTLYEVNTAATRISKEVGDSNANIIFGAIFNPELKGIIRISIVATGIDADEENSNSVALDIHEERDILSRIIQEKTKAFPAKEEIKAEITGDRFARNIGFKESKSFAEINSQQSAISHSGTLSEETGKATGLNNHNNSNHNINEEIELRNIHSFNPPNVTSDNNLQNTDHIIREKSIPLTTGTDNKPSILKRMWNSLVSGDSSAGRKIEEKEITRDGAKQISPSLSTNATDPNDIPAFLRKNNK